MTDVAFDPARFRQVLGHFATGVSVITAMDGDTPVGLAIGSFFSISLDPPLVGFCAAKSSTSWPRIRAVGAFSVNVLAEDQEDICRVFASKEPDKFSGAPWSPSAHGQPLLAGVLASIDCDLEVVHDAGDHEIVVGAVRDLRVKREGGPLIFFRGGYANLA
ncbi:MAG: flavin reductase domain protein FMN-binding protein [Acidimicrobiales bacterium]|nr:flavin reductase domain protein FMN-binding protein [Acidimicrobiales bacterium]